MKHTPSTTLLHFFSCFRILQCMGLCVPFVFLWYLTKGKFEPKKILSVLIFAQLGKATKIEKQVTVPITNKCVQPYYKARMVCIQINWPHYN